MIHINARTHECLYALSVGDKVRALNGVGDSDEGRGAMVENLRFVATPSEAFEPSWIQSYGIIDGGLELSRCAFPRLEHKFSVRRPEHLSMLEHGDTSKVHTSRGVRWSLTLLKRHPVDLLVMELGGQKRPTSKFDNGQERWETLVESVPEEKRPKVVVEAWSGAAILWRNGPASQGYGSRWKARGYDTQIRSINACHVGGAVNQSRLIVLRIAEGVQWNWSDLHDQTTPRPMSNLLTPAGLVPTSVKFAC